MADVSRTHYLLPFERRAAERVLKQYEANPTGRSRREEYNLGTEGIRLKAAAGAYPFLQVVVAPAVVSLIAIVCERWIGLTAAEWTIAVAYGAALVVMLGAFVRQTQVLLVGHSHRAGRRYLKTWEVPPPADASEPAGPFGT
jgi:hypothetical protein